MEVFHKRVLFGSSGPCVRVSTLALFLVSFYVGLTDYLNALTTTTHKSAIGGRLDGTAMAMQTPDIVNG